MTFLSSVAFLKDSWFELCLLTITLYVLQRWTRSRSRNRSTVSTSGKAVLITGCDSGFGFQLAKLFDRLGYDVYAGCLSPEGSGAEMLRAIKSPRLRVVDLDITDDVKVRRTYEELNAKLGDQGLWCLINNAGVLCFGEFEWLTWEQCLKQVNVNLVGTLRVTKTFLPLLMKSKGRVVTVTSVNAFVALPLLTVYCATKTALEGFCNSLRLEITRHGVQVVAFEPGDFGRLTGIMANHTVNARNMWDSMTPEVRARDGDYFKKLQKRIENARYDLIGPTALDSSTRLFDDFEHAVGSLNPKRRYFSASWKEWIMYTILTLIPSSVSDTLISYIYKKVINKL